MERYAIHVMDETGRSRCYVVTPLKVEGPNLRVLRGAAEILLPMLAILDSAPIDGDTPLHRRIPLISQYLERVVH